LCRDHAKQCCGRCFILCENPAWITQVAKLYRKAQSIVVAAMLAYGRQVTNTQNVIPQQILLFVWKGAQRFALRGSQEFAARHATILIMNSEFENYDRCDFRDSMTSLILDGGAGRPHRIPSSRDNSAKDSLRSFIQVLAYVNFRFLS
jgi:Zn-dependent M28 family amino/carboxypeptidase